MKASELRKKNLSELLQELRESLREQFNLRMQRGFNVQQVKPNALRKVRHHIARIKTIMHEKAKQS